MAERQERCETCRWCLLVGKYVGIKPIYACRRNPPLPFSDLLEDLRIAKSRWPKVEGDDFCGEWTAREPSIDHEILARSVSFLNLSVRARRILNQLGIKTIGDLTRKTAQEMLATRQCGFMTVGELSMRLRAHGLDLAR